MKSKYNDVPAVVQVIGGIYLRPSLLDIEDKYFFSEEDFTEDFHKVVFGSIYNLHSLGAKEITPNEIEDYLEQRPKQLAVYKSNRGREYLDKMKDICQVAAFDYYYKRVKKMTLFRLYEGIGVNLSWLYDPDNILDAKKKQAQEDWLDSTDIADIAQIFDDKIDEIRAKCIDDASGSSVNAGDGGLALLQRLKEVPEVGYPLYGNLFNTITRGARLKKLYLRSAATGVGKSRSMIADIANMACDEIYDIKEKKWKKNGTREPALFVTTEQEIEELQTMIYAFLSGVNEEKILTGNYDDDEWERVQYAVKVATRCPLYLEELPDFSIKDIENTLKRNIREHGVKYLGFDYIHTSMKILSEVTQKTGIKGLREDNVLFMISIKLKDLCNQYGVFILTSTQLNSEKK